MNSKLLAVGAGTFGFGALLGWALTADHFDGKMKRNQLILGEMLSRKEATIVSLEERVLARVPWNAPSDEAVQAAAAKVTGDILTDSEAQAIDLAITDPDGTYADVETPAVVDHSPKLRELIERYTANPDDVDEFVAMGSKVIEFSESTPPFHIPRDVFASDPEEGDAYDKVTLTYYPRTRVLIDDDKELVSDVDHHVGWNNLNRFGDESGDPDTVFVRNRRLRVDYEVVREEDEDPPLHIRYGMDRETFNTNVAAGIIKMPKEEDSA